MVTTSIGINLKAARARAGIKATELAARASMSPSTISAIERGRVLNPGAAKLNRLAEALGIQVEVLLTPALVGSANGAAKSNDAGSIRPASLNTPPDSHRAVDSSVNRDCH